MRARVSRFTVFALAAMASTLVTSLAWSHDDITYQPTVTYHKLTYNLGAGDVVVRRVLNPADPACGAMEAFGTIPGPRLYWTPCKVGCGLYILDGATAGGGLGTSAVAPDTLYAGVGIYHDPLPGTGGMNIAIVRNAGNVSLTFSGGLQASSNGPQNEVTYRVLVYPDAATANADSTNRSGVGAVFEGTVSLFGHTGNRVATGGFSDPEWTLTTDPPLNNFNRYTLQPVAALNKVVTVPNGANAYIVAIADPRSMIHARGTANTVPGLSPVGLALLTLVLLGAGVWAIRSRQRELAG